MRKFLIKSVHDSCREYQERDEMNRMGLGCQNCTAEISDYKHPVLEKIPQTHSDPSAPPQQTFVILGPCQLVEQTMEKGIVLRLQQFLY